MAIFRGVTCSDIFYVLASDFSYFRRFRLHRLSARFVDLTVPARFCTLL